jgi:uncharacterized cupin superfamily protein
MSVVSSIRFDRNAPVDKTARTTTHNRVEDASGALSSDFWASMRYRVEVDCPDDEFCRVREGSVGLTDAVGRCEECGAGGAFVIPRGFKGVWEMVEVVKKFYVVHQPTRGS